mmetsp:Transcript_2483/g.4285  ORF Transcript_2483/g.4285 Transcript_2483/m.4285 type:complete len:96 (+) Transcript_2483:54-341(+)
MLWTAGAEREGHGLLSGVKYVDVWIESLQAFQVSCLKPYDSVTKEVRLDFRGSDFQVRVPCLDWIQDVTAKASYKAIVAESRKCMHQDRSPLQSV